MTVRDSNDPERERRRRQLLVRGAFGFIAGAMGGVLTGLTWLDSWWFVSVTTLASGALCAYLAATRGDRFWEQLNWLMWP